MKKMRFLLYTIVTVFLFIGCSKIDNNTKVNAEKNNNSYEKFSKEDVEKLVMVNGELYYNTEKESKVTARCGTMDGEITSMVNQDEIPKENDQSNFGKGYGYQIGFQEGQIELNINNKWIVFEKL